MLFRVKEIVEASGAGFAFPTQTLYLDRDGGPNAGLAGKAKEEVAMWRRTGQLPFPRLPASRIKALAGRLHYPPRGSPDFNAPGEDRVEGGGEHLSAEARTSEPPGEKTEAPVLANERT